MPCPHCVSADQLFNEPMARKELKKLHQSGPSGSTRLLLSLLEGPVGTVLDIGGGVGAIQHALAARGAVHVTGVDASRAYLAVAREEAERLGYAERSDQRFGDFVELADAVDAASIVTLDRVLCCYPDLAALVGKSARKARERYGVVFPKERWWTVVGVRALNLFMWLTRSDYRAYVHPEAAVDALVADAGLRRTQTGATWLWNVWVYERATASI